MKFARDFTFTQFTASALIWVAVFCSASVLALESSAEIHLDHGKAAICDCGMHNPGGECDHKEVSGVIGFGETDPAHQITAQGTLDVRDVTAWKPEGMAGFAETDPASRMTSETTGIAPMSDSPDDALQLGQHGQTNSVEPHCGDDHVTHCSC